MRNGVSGLLIEQTYEYPEWVKFDFYDLILETLSEYIVLIPKNLNSPATTLVSHSE